MRRRSPARRLCGSPAALHPPRCCSLDGRRGDRLRTARPAQAEKIEEVAPELTHRLVPSNSLTGPFFSAEARNETRFESSLVARWRVGWEPAHPQAVKYLTTPGPTTT